MQNKTALHLLAGTAAVAFLMTMPFRAAAFGQTVPDLPSSASPTVVDPNTLPTEAKTPKVDDPAAAPSDDRDIVITARRRDERSLQVPVVVTAFSGQQLSKLGVTSVSDIARLTPQLSAELNVGSFGGFNTLRGVTSPTSSTSADPAVIVVIDNIPIGTGSVNRLGQFDLGQAEILKGPQALFFGKNSSGGIISLTSAEPTEKSEIVTSIEYETRASEWQFNGVVSGPITDSLKGRFAIRGDVMRGYFYNLVPNVDRRVGPDPKELAMRGTLIFDPSSNLTMKLKATYDRITDDGSYMAAQRFFCPSGVPSGASASPTITDCKADRYFQRGDQPKNLDQLTGDPLFHNDGTPYTKTRQILLSYDVNYKLSPTISLNSITGYYDLDQSYSDLIVRGANPTIVTTGSDRKNIFSEELRLFSDKSDSSFTWMIGAFYQNDRLYDTEHVVLYTPATVAINSRPRGFWRINSDTYSAFAQMSWEFIKGLSISGGARYTHEHRFQSVNLSNKFRPTISYNNVSPEATLAYKPNGNLNIYASYKEGYKSGTFQIGTLVFPALIANPAITTIDNSYKAETVHGFEGGIKAALFDRQLRVEAAVYSYLYSNLQLSSFDPVQSVTRISNATSARIKGAEIQLNFAPRSAPGFQVFGALSYNDARYKNFIGACYVGQTIAQGCTIDGPDVGTVPDLQDFTDHTLLRAPKWSGNAGISYDTNIGSFLKVGANVLVSYQSSSYLAQEETPWGIRPATTLVDGGVRIGAEGGRWEFAVIGKNLTNRYYPVSGFQESGTGNPVTTGTTVGKPSDYSGTISRPREVRLRLTFRF